MKAIGEAYPDRNINSQIFNYSFFCYTSFLFSFTFSVRVHTKYLIHIEKYTPIVNFGKFFFV